MRKFLVAAVAFMLLVPLTGSAQKTKGSFTLPFAQALAIAQSNTSGLTLLYGRAEEKGPSKTPVWGFYFMLPDRTILEKEISGTNGSIFNEKVIDSIVDGPKNKIDPAVILALKSKTLTKLPTLRYLEIASDKSGGGPATKYEVVMGDPMKVQVGGDGWQVVMDMSTGKVLSSK